MVEIRTTDRSGRELGKAIVRTWLVAGTLDITAASLYYPPVYKFRLILLYQNIASGVFGDGAFRGGVPMAAAGLGFHYFIALAWTVLFFAAYPRFAVVRGNMLMVGALYGIIVWAVMNLVVLPLSRVERGPLTPGHAIIAALFLVFCIGIPISIMTGRYYDGRASSPHQGK